MAEQRRVVTANLPIGLVLQMEKAGAKIERSKSWIVRRALIEWLEKERREEAV